MAVLLATVDFRFILHAYTSTLTKGPSVQLVFGFEYAILLTIVANTVVKYILHGIDLYSENPWENKAVFMLYTELVIGFIKVISRVSVSQSVSPASYSCPLCLIHPILFFYTGNFVFHFHRDHGSHLHSAFVCGAPDVPDDEGL